MKGYIQTVTGPVKKEDMGLTLPHEHLLMISLPLSMNLFTISRMCWSIKKSVQIFNGG